MDAIAIDKRLKKDCTALQSTDFHSSIQSIEISAGRGAFSVDVGLVHLANEPRGSGDDGAIFSFL